MASGKILTKNKHVTLTNLKSAIHVDFGLQLRLKAPHFTGGRNVNGLSVLTVRAAGDGMKNDSANRPKMFVKA